MSKALEWGFVEAEDGRAERRGNGSALKEETNDDRSGRINTPYTYDNNLSTLVINKD